MRLAAFGADLLVVCDYGQILAPATLAAARRGGVNLHASLLPKYRGAAPINWAIYHGETETGVTVIHMTAANRRRPLHCPSFRVPIGPDETAAELEARLAELGARLDVRRRSTRWTPATTGLASRRRASQPSPAAEEDRRPDRLDPPGRGHQEPRSGDGALAENLHLLALARRPAAAA